MLSRVDYVNWIIPITPVLFKVRGFSPIEINKVLAATPPSKRANDAVKSLPVLLMFTVETLVADVVVVMDDLVLNVLWDRATLWVNPIAKVARYDKKSTVLHQLPFRLSNLIFGPLEGVIEHLAACDHLCSVLESLCLNRLKC